MTTRSDYAIQKSLDHLYLNAAWSNIGNATGLPAAATAGNLYAALFVGASEAAYGGYVRIPIPRTGSGFSRTGNVITNVAQINFVKSTADGGTATKVAIYDQVSGGNQLHLQTLASGIPTSTNVQPIIEAGALTVTGS